MFILVFICLLSSWEFQNNWFVSSNYGWGISSKDSILAIQSGYGADLMNIANPVNPLLLSNVRTEGYSYDVCMIGSHLYICDGYAGLRIFDISDPQNPVELACQNTPGSATKVTVRDSFAYVADDFSGLRIINVSNPTQPFEIGFLDTPGEAIWVDVESIYAYVGDFLEGLQIINIEDPSAPYLVAQWTDPDLWYVWGVEAIDTLAYLSGDYLVAGEFMNLIILSIADPANPIYIAGASLPQPADGLSIVDTWAYVCAQNAGVRIINISDPYNPFEVGYVPGHPGYDILVVDSILYTARHRNLGIYDVADPANPESLYSYVNPQPYTLDVLYDTILFTFSLHDSVLIQAFDCSIPDSISILDEIAIAVPNPQFNVGTLFFDSPYLYCGHYDLLSILSFVDNHLTPISTVPIPAVCINKKNDYLYIGSGSYDTVSFRVYDVSNINVPELVCMLPSVNCYDIEFLDTLAFVTGEYYFYVLNIVDPINVSIVCSLSTQHIGRDMVLSLPYSFIGNNDFCIQIIDLTNPASPQLLNTIPTVNHNLELMILDTLLLSVGGDIGGLQVYNIIDPINPYLVDSFDTPGYGQKLTRNGQFFFIADYFSLELVKYLDNDISENYKDDPYVPYVSLYPIPARNEVQFILPASNTRIEIYDVLGRKLDSFVIKKGKYTWICKDNRGFHLPNGIYFIVFQTENAVEVKKILLLR